MPDNEALTLAVTLSELLDQLDRVVAVPLGTERGGERLGIAQRKGTARAALVPLDDGEIILRGPLERPGHRHLDRARAAMDEEQDRVVAVGAADVHHPPRAAARHFEGFLDAVGGDDAVEVGDDYLCSRVA